MLYISYSSSSKSPAPCRPDNVLVNLQCSTNLASVTWGNSGPDQTQVVSAVDSGGRVTTCNSSSSNCTFDQLTCGESYVFSVVGHTNSCSSEPTVSQRLNTGSVTNNLAKDNVMHRRQLYKQASYLFYFILILKIEPKIIFVCKCSSEM